MLYSTERIITTHAGSLPRSADLRDMVVANANGQAHDIAALAAPLKAAVADVVRRQAKCANDGELSKTNFTDYVRWRMAGYVERPSAGPRRLSITARDETKFAEYFTANPPARSARRRCRSWSSLCAIRAERDRRQLANFKAALGGVSVAEAFLSANSPGTIEHWLTNPYYKTDEEFLFAIAEVMGEKYRAIVDAGLLLQIDDPDLPDGWNCLPAITLPEYRNYAALRVEALNHALSSIPKEQFGCMYAGGAITARITTMCR
jgi:5-methyltetrahydropteroyltriglutamate--homocysteine methyltransferase